MKPHELLDYAAKDPATWSKDEVRRLLREAATAITKQQQDAERYRFIRDSTPEQFDQFEPGLYSGGDELDELTDAAMAGANTCSAAPLSLIPQPNTGPADKNPE